MMMMMMMVVKDYDDDDDGGGGGRSHLSVGAVAKKVGAGKQGLCQNQWHMISLRKHSFTFADIRILCRINHTFAKINGIY